MKNTLTIMLFELFITIYFQIQLLSKDIFSYCNSKFKNNHKSAKQNGNRHCYYELEYNFQKILRS